MSKKQVLASTVGLVAAMAACGDGGNQGNAPVSLSALPTSVPAPLTNVSSSEKVALGRLLFWDPILSGEKDVACASCHHPNFGYADGRATSIGTGGVGLGPARTIAPGAPRPTRNAMTILDVAFNGATTQSPASPADAPMFWDDRARALEHQAEGPMTAVAEMMGPRFSANTIFDEVSARLRANTEYVSLFAAAFGTTSSIDRTTITEAIASFERTIVDSSSSYDRYVAGDSSAMSASARRGLSRFESGGCANCHSGPMFSDYQHHRLGVPDLPGAAHDVGDGNDAFRTASLRNVARTAPYMHDGVFATLDDVYRFYLRADDRADDPLLRRVRAPQGNDAADVTAFLQSLSDGAFDATVPSSVPSGLIPGGSAR